MLCPACSAASRVVDSRAARGGRATRRRRECLECRQRFTTYERVEERMPRVRKADGSAEDFQRAKLEASIAVACAKRPVPPGAIEALADQVEDRLAGSARSQIASAEIGEEVMEALKPLDRVAYVRYASVYRDFQDIAAFQEVVDELIVGERRENRRRAQVELPLYPADADKSGAEVL